MKVEFVTTTEHWTQELPGSASFASGGGVIDEHGRTFRVVDAWLVFDEKETEPSWCVALFPEAGEFRNLMQLYPTLQELLPEAWDLVQDAATTSRPARTRVGDAREPRRAVIR